MNGLVIIAILGAVVIIFAFVLGATHYKMFDALVDKAKNETKTVETDIENLMTRTERNVKASILSDEEFLTALADKIKTVGAANIKNV